MTKKRIFISDIHMGDRRSIIDTRPPYPYCWFYNQPFPIGNRPEMLTTFLTDYYPSADEVVILGDLFDEWICPREYDPTDPPHPMPPLSKQLENIAKSGQNLSVIAALQQLAAAKKLKYIPGNHDMLADRAAVEGPFPGIEYIETERDEHPVCCADGIWAEHGHWYGLFNAPYKVATGDAFGASVLPLGFIISRLVAESALKTGSRFTPMDVIGEWLKQHIHPMVSVLKDVEQEIRDGVLDGLVETFMNTMISEHAYDFGNQGVLMNGFDGIPGWLDWTMLISHYAPLFRTWSDSHRGNVGVINAVVDDSGDLSPAAGHVANNHDDARIIIFGHTHGCLLTSNVRLNTPGMQTAGGEPIYANSGAWCNDTGTCTFIETEFDPATGIHSVQPRKWVKQADGTYGASDYCKGEAVKVGPDTGASVPIPVPTA